MTDELLLGRDLSPEEMRNFIFYTRAYHSGILNDISDKSADMWEWSPNNEKNLHLWRFWESEL